MPDSALAYATALHQAGRLEEAERAYRAILSIDSNQADAAGMLGVLLHQTNRRDEALEQLRHASGLAPRSPLILSNLGMVLANARQLDEAERVLRLALQIQPDLLTALLNLGKVLLIRGQYPASFEVYRSATRRFDTSAEAWCGIGDAHQAMHLAEPAKLAYQKAIALQNLPAARLGLASTYLLEGDFARGWPLYEARWEVSGRSPGAGFPQPRWDGRAQPDKTILLHAEQGLGDTIQFIRFARTIRQKFARTILLVPPALATLLANIEGIDQIVSDRHQVGAFDMQSPLLSLPGILRTSLQTIPDCVPIPMDAARIAYWKSRLTQTKPAIGIAWAGSPLHENDSQRSIPFEQLRPLLEVPGVRWMSLQIERREQHRRLTDWTGELQDLTDTAALMSNLDLVITADTAVAHLAGSLQKTTWLLLPYAPDWRWMWHRDDSPWYPSMRLFRQTTPGDWSGPIQRVGAALHQLRHI